MSDVDKIMALADIYAQAWYANQSSRVVAAYDDGSARKALRAAIVEALDMGAPVAWKVDDQLFYRSDWARSSAAVLECSVIPLYAARSKT